MYAVNNIKICNTYITFGGFLMELVKETARYFCAGRNCQLRETCHRHTSSVTVTRPEFDDYDIAMLYASYPNCKYYIDIRQVNSNTSTK
jgi:hypothetical protein